MSKKQITVKQHYIPRMYLKRWVHGDIDKLYVISRQLDDLEIHDVSYDDTLFYKEYCYDITMPDGTLYTKNDVEAKLGAYETKHDRLLNRMIIRLDDDQKVLDKGTNRIEDFLEFISLIIIRNPNNRIPLDFNGIKTTSNELSKSLLDMFGGEWNLSGLQIAANSMNHDLLFKVIDKLKALKPECYFLESTDNTRFITSNNPVLCTERWSYIALSPRYACFLLFDTRINWRFEKNKKFALNDSEVIKYNKLFWKHEDNDTIIGINPDDLEKAL